ncbi:MAG: Asp-tRNA(Asn)/Glu-tRNA(Gln) amidotransferase subunit GatC [Clostridia bacterium]|nr:Asp-tRNA(Asn)/Glu-tRNA(Gln) amidotransferase subunit GatC [Clostridia bacterium]
MLISRPEVQHVAFLARLRLTEEEVELYTRDLGSILGYVNKLHELDIEGVEPMAHVLPLQNVLREDEPRPGLPREAALANAPEAVNGQVKVPRVV